MNEHKQSNSEQTGSKLSALTDGFFAFLLVISSLHCLISSFDLNVNSAVVIICAIMFTAVFTGIAAFVESKSKYAMSIGVIFMVFILTVLFSYGTLASQLNYVINVVLKDYSVFLAVPESVKFAATATEATALFVTLSALLCGVLTFFLIRMRFIFPAAAVSIIVIIPCFILINTLPDLLPLLTMFTVLFTLFVTSAVHRTNTAHSPAVSSLVAVLMAVLVTVVFIFNPLEGYERSLWQEDLLAFTRASLGLEVNDGTSFSVASVTKNIRQEIDLSNSGPVKKTNQKIMTINSPYDGRLYLRGVAYANYSDNTWSLLTDEQAESYPENFASLSMTRTQDVPRTTMNIITERDEEVIYTPYFLSEVPASGAAVYDILIKNDKNVQNYDVDFQNYTTELQYPTDFSSDLLIIDGDSIYYGDYYGKNLPPQYSINSYYYVKNQEAIAYKDFVYENYLSVPENVRTEMIQLALKNGFGYQAKQDVINSVKDFVAGSASYSLDTEKVPAGKDISLWLLTESETGYCVHFATSATLMLRSMGIPARYVTGYCVEVDKLSSATTIVSSDNAHAWVEYFDNDIGWVPLDATPPDFTVPVYTDLGRPTQPPTTAPQTEATTVTTQPTTKADDKITAKPSFEMNAVSVIILVITAILLAVLTVLLRRQTILVSRHKRFTKGSPNKRAKHIYRYLLRISKYSHVSVPEEIEDIADKACFSGRRITNNELEIITRFAESRTKALASDSPIIKKLYLRYILALI